MDQALHKSLRHLILPTAFTVAFAFIAGLFSLYYTAKTPECFTACGWPIQYITQIPQDSLSVSFAVNYFALIGVWLFWYLLGCILQGIFYSAVKKQPKTFQHSLRILLLVFLILLVILTWHDWAQISMAWQGLFT